MAGASLADDWGAMGAPLTRSGSESAAGSGLSAKLAAMPIASKIGAFLGVAATIGVIVGTVAAMGSSNRRMPSYSALPEQIKLSAAWDGLDASHSVHVLWTIPYGSSCTAAWKSSEGAGSGYYLPSPSAIVNPGAPALNPRVEWGFSPSGPLPYSTAATQSTYQYLDKSGNYTSPLLFNATVGCATSNAAEVTSSRGAGAGSGAAGVAGGAGGVRGSAGGCAGALQPGQIFYYRVGDDANGFSETMVGRILPAAGTPGVTFAVIGDLGTTNNSADTVAHILASDAGTSAGAGSDTTISAVVQVGDLSYADGQQQTWDTYGQVIQPLASIVPWMNIVGNHEWFDFNSYTFGSYMARFRNPAPLEWQSDASRLYYTFSSGLVTFIMLQGYCPSMSATSTQPCLAEGSAQLSWLRRTLSSVDRTLTPWIVVTFHQPYMNSNTAHSIAAEGMPMKNAVEDAIYAGGVDLVLSGHVHAYERSCRAYNFTCVGARNASAPYYITIGDGGNREGLADAWVAPQPAWSVFRQASYGHGQLTAVNETHMLWEWHQNPDLAPTVADSFWIVKGAAGPVGPGTTGAPQLSAEAQARGATLRFAEPGHAQQH